MNGKTTEPADAHARMQPFRAVWYSLTALSAITALFLEPALFGAVNRGAVVSAWLFVPVGCFVAFFAGYAFDRWRLVRARRYRRGRALVQTFLGILLASVLFSSTMSDYRSRRVVGFERLLTHSDMEIRKAAVYAMGFLGHEGGRLARVLGALDDKSATVRDASWEVLARWSRRPREDVTGIRAWAEALSRSSTTSGETRSP